MGKPASPQGDRPRDTSTLRRLGRKTGIGALGGVVTAAGVVMLVTPGPGLLVTALGLGILGREFPSAQRPLQRLRRGRTPKHDGGPDAS